MLNFSNVILHTNGSGLWSKTRKSVPITKVILGYVNTERDFGELCVFFNTSIWDIRKDGLIYTDKLFLKELQQTLNDMGLNGSDVYYSEQGMQGRDYVSLDVGDRFIRSYDEQCSEAK